MTTPGIVTEERHGGTLTMLACGDLPTHVALGCGNDVGPLSWSKQPTVFEPGTGRVLEWETDEVQRSRVVATMTGMAQAKADAAVVAA